MHCLKCDRDVQPMIDLTPNGVVNVCPSCNSALERVTKHSPQAPVPRNEGTEAATPTPPVRGESPRPGPSAFATDTTEDITFRIESRLAAVRVELARLGGLKQEEKQLARLLKAAKSKPKPRGPVHIGRDGVSLVVQRHGLNGEHEVG